MTGRNFGTPSLLLFAAALLLGACSSDDGASSANTIASTTAESSTTAPSDSAGDDEPDETTEADGGGEFVVAVRNWEDGQAIPVEFTCDDADRSPQATLTAVPAETSSLALIVDDPDAPGEQPFVHFVVYGMDVTTREIDGSVPEFTYGQNDFGVSGWSGPCPPEGDGPHSYRWRLFALDETLELEPDLDGRALEAAIESHVLETALFTATYER